MSQNDIPLHWLAALYSTPHHHIGATTQSPTRNPGTKRDKTPFREKNRREYKRRRAAKKAQRRRGKRCRR